MNPIALIPGVLLANTATVYYKVPEADNRLKQIQVTGMRFVNTDSSARTVTVHIVPSGKSASDATLRFQTMTVQPSSLGEPPLYFYMDDVLLPGDTIHALASVGSKVAFSVNGVQYP